MSSPEFEIHAGKTKSWFASNGLPSQIHVVMSPSCLSSNTISPAVFTSRFPGDILGLSMLSGAAPPSSITSPTRRDPVSGLTSSGSSFLTRQRPALLSQGGHCNIDVTDNQNVRIARIVFGTGGPLFTMKGNSLFEWLG